MTRSDTPSHTVTHNGATYRVSLVHGRLHLTFTPAGSRYANTVPIPIAAARELVPHIAALVAVAGAAKREAA